METWEKVTLSSWRDSNSPSQIFITYIYVHINVLIGSSRITYGEPGMDINDTLPAGMVTAAIITVSHSSTEAPVKHKM